MEQSIAPFATVAMMLVFTAFTGCEKKPEVYTTRGADPQYKEALRQTRIRQNEKGDVRVRVVAQMKELAERARAALPQGATDEQIKAELEGNPQKYPGWSALSAALAKTDAELKAEMANARKTVRERIFKEAADRKAVAEGRAVAKEPAAAK
ncbi:MAG: hypothetical protein ACI4RA_10980 [Kiritimatiellia bacterium]